MVALVDDLEAKRLIERRRHSSERRASLIHPAALGIEAQAAAIKELRLPVTPGVGSDLASQSQPRRSAVRTASMRVVASVFWIADDR